LQLKGQWRAQLPEKRSGYVWNESTLDHALYVPLNQPLGRLAFYLLDPRSGDGFVFWGYLHPYYARGRGMWGELPRQPILAVGMSAGEATSESNPAKIERAQE
jgi:hypothetical protein